MGKDRTAGRNGHLHRTDEDVDASAIERGKPTSVHNFAMPVNEIAVEHGQRPSIARHVNGASEKRSKLEEWREPRFTLRRRTAPGWYDHNHGSVRADSDSDLNRQLIRQESFNLGAALQNSLGLRKRIYKHPGADIRHVVQAVVHRGHDAKVSATATQCPKELALAVVARERNTSIRENDFSRKQIIESETKAADQWAVAAAQSEACHPDGANGSRDGCKAKWICRFHNITSAGPSRNSRRMRGGVNEHAIHSTQVNNDSVAQRATSPVVATATH